MAIWDDIYTRLTGHSGLNALISGRLYIDDEVPENPTYPYIVWREIAHPKEQAIDRSIGFHMPFVEFECWAERAATKSGVVGARNVRDQLEAALVAMTGNTVTINGMEIEGGDTGYDPDIQKHRANTTATVLHQ